MKTLYLSQNGNIVVDTENNATENLKTADRYDIRTMYVIEEPMHVVYGRGEDKEEFDANEKDIVIMFYDQVSNKRKIIAVNSPEWFDNLMYKFE